METKHTPGPWSVSGVRTRESGEPVLQICGADGKAYAMVFYSDKTVKEHAASYADAHLIAAAPDMLDRLCEARHHINAALSLSEENRLALAVQGRAMLRGIDATIAKVAGSHSLTADFSGTTHTLP